MKAVANSSVLIALSSIGQLTLLPQRFAEGIFIPIAVWEEVVKTGKGRPGAYEVQAASAWITVREVADSRLRTLLHTQLDNGEAEAITLSIQESVNLILLDERAARQKAVALGLTVLGTVGMLIWAKREGLIDKLRPQLEILQTRGHFRLSRSVCEHSLRSVGED